MEGNQKYNEYQRWWNESNDKSQDINMKKKI